MINNGRGVTLVELLVVVAISSIFVTIAYSVLFTGMKSVDNSMNETNLTNESVLITTRFERYLQNVDTIYLLGRADNNGRFKSFEAVDRKQIEVSPGVYVEQEESSIFEIRNGSLFIDGQIVNSDQYSLEDTAFFYNHEHGELTVFYHITHIQSMKKNEFLKIYLIQRSE